MSDPSTDEVRTHARIKRPLVGMVIVVSFLIGGVAGGVSGALFGGFGDTVSSWISGDTIQSSVKGDSNSRVLEASDTVKLVATIDPAVVSVISTREFQQYRSEPFFGPFFRDVPTGETERVQIGGGSGFIVSADGLILTNKHVVSDKDVDYTVVLSDGTEYKATVVDTDPFNDLAVIRIEAKGLPIVELGNSDDVRVGETVLAFGNALGEYSNSVTRGIISGLDRSVTAGGYSGTSLLENVIQTDAAINPGNSGGPLADLAGRVIGVNTAIDAQGQSIGFAIPINEAKPVIESIQKYGRIVRPILGVRYTVITPALAKQQGLSVDHGALVTSGVSSSDPAVVEGSAAAEAGVQAGDIITHLDGTEITEDQTLAGLIKGKKVGDTIKITVLRGDKTLELTSTLKEYGVQAS